MKMKMRKFTDLDWNMYQGVSYSHPLIGDTDNMVVILDGLRIDIYYDNPGEITTGEYFKMFNTKDDAWYFLRRHLNEKTTQRDLKLFGFNRI